MKYPHFFEQDDSYTAAFSLTDFRAQVFEEGLDVPPLQIRAGWMREERFKRALMLALHGAMVL